MQMKYDNPNHGTNQPAVLAWEDLKRILRDWCP